MVNSGMVNIQKEGGVAMNAKFFRLPEERQDLIRNSAMVEFGEGTFRKTSADAIAKRAGVSKSLLFYYFKDKRELYLYLFQHAIDECVGKYLGTVYDSGETDFFRLLEQGHRIKMEMVRRMPGMFRFVMRAYYERDSVLTPRLRKKLDQLMEQATDDFLAHVDLYKFRDGVNPKEVVRLILLACEGMLAETGACTAAEINALFGEYQRHADMLRRFLYKEEYL